MRIHIQELSHFTLRNNFLNNMEKYRRRFASLT